LDVRSRVTTNGRELGWVLVAAGALALAACKAESCEPALVNIAMTFLEEHQSCVVDDDCVAVSDFCGTLPHGYCGQLVMNREGNASAKWADITKELKECSPEECTLCDALLVPRCSDGSCNGP
jgi:hypothetical protein